MVVYEILKPHNPIVMHNFFTYFINKLLDSYFYFTYFVSAQGLSALK